MTSHYCTRVFLGNSNTLFDCYIKNAIAQKESYLIDPLRENDTGLNRIFTLSEVHRAVMKCKNGKAARYDHTPYEVLKNDKVISVLVSLFQLHFDSGKVPSAWKKSIICSIEKLKEKDPRIPLHYQGISLLCCSSKMYSSLLNNRMINYLNNNNCICDEQNGFHKDRSCRDHVFILDSILRNLISEDQSVFAAFIDFQKAFDCIDRDYLFFKVLEKRIDGKMFWAIKSLYKETEVCVRINNQLTGWFSCTYGVRQGDTMSSTLFSIFINDLVKKINDLNKGIQVGHSQVSILLYADDVLLLADSHKKLQDLMDHLYKWSHNWKIFINESKSKVVHFHKRCVPRSNHAFVILLWFLCGYFMCFCTQCCVALFLCMLHCVTEKRVSVYKTNKELVTRLNFVYFVQLCICSPCLTPTPIQLQ